MDGWMENRNHTAWKSETKTLANLSEARPSLTFSKTEKKSEWNLKADITVFFVFMRNQKEEKKNSAPPPPFISVSGDLSSFP